MKNNNKKTNRTSTNHLTSDQHIVCITKQADSGSLQLLPNWGGFHEAAQRLTAFSRGRRRSLIPLSPLRSSPAFILCRNQFLCIRPSSHSMATAMMRVTTTAASLPAASSSPNVHALEPRICAMASHFRGLGMAATIAPGSQRLASRKPVRGVRAMASSNGASVPSGLPIDLRGEIGFVSSLWGLLNVVV
jgi:hypothetical protein